MRVKRDIDLMITIFREELRDLDTSVAALRSFGLLIGAVLLAVAGGVLWLGGWNADPVVYILTAAGGLLVLMGAITPYVLKPVYMGWMTLAVVLGFVMTRLLLTVVFYGIVTPIGLIMRVAGRDPLNRAIDPEAPTYWIQKSDEDHSPERLEKYY